MTCYQPHPKIKSELALAEKGDFMQSIKLHSHTGADGMLKLEVPMGLANTDFEVVLIVQPVAKAESSPEDLG